MTDRLVGDRYPVFPFEDSGYGVLVEESGGGCFFLFDLLEEGGGFAGQVDRPTFAAGLSLRRLVDEVV